MHSKSLLRELFHETLKKSLKEKSFVHGDLRCQNILLSGTSQFAVVDFDWAGEYGDVKYPLDIILAETCVGLQVLIVVYSQTAAMITTSWTICYSYYKCAL